MTPTQYSSMLAIALTVAALSSCNRQNQQPQYANYATGNPADGNLAPAVQNAAPTSQTPADYQTPPASAAYQTEEPAYYQPIAQAPEPPPPLPEYSQPPCPGENYEWTPGYWDYSNTGYYWVPGAWVMAPWVGALWTPPWWGFENNDYVLHPGYWGPHIGFYGGIDYGYGYTGHGYYGAYWDRGALRYNRVVTNVNPAAVRNVYNYRVPDHRQDRISYNGGRGGVDVRPSARELAVVRDPRTPPVVEQVQHARQAASNVAQFASRDHGRPAALAASAPLATRYHAPSPHPPAAAVREVARPAPVVRPVPVAHNQPHPSAQPNVPARQQSAHFERPGNITRPPQLEPHGARPTPAPPSASAFNRPNAPTTMQREQPPNRPTPENRRLAPPRPGQVQATAHPAQVAPRTPAVMPRPEPQPRREPQRAMAPPRPQPQHAMAPRPEPQRAIAPRPQPQHAMAPRPEPQRAIAPRPQPQHAMEPRVSQPRPEPRHALEPRPAPHVVAQAQHPPAPHAPAPHPVPQARPEPRHAAPAARPAPPSRPEEHKRQ